MWSCGGMEKIAVSVFVTTQINPTPKGWIYGCSSVACVRFFLPVLSNTNTTCMVKILWRIIVRFLRELNGIIGLKFGVTLTLKYLSERTDVDPCIGYSTHQN
jgi:hypothetical protein